MPNQDIEQAVIAQERRALDRWAKGDPVGYLDAFWDDASYFDDIAAQDRVDGLDALRAYAATVLEGNIPPHEYEIVNPRVQVYGDVAVLTLRYHPRMPGGDPLTPWKATSVYQRKGDAWGVSHAHWSMVKEA